MLRIEGQWVRRRAALVVGVAVLTAINVAGCGGAGTSSPSSTTSRSSQPDEPSKEFNDYKGIRGVEPVATFGKEADETERQGASSVLSENLAARQEGDFSVQCATLARVALETLLGPEAGTGAQARCKAALEKFAEPLAQSEAARADTLGGEIAALRVKGNRAFALYHGTDGNDYAIPMDSERGTWKVGAIVTLELPKTPPHVTKTKDENGKKGGQG